MTIKPHLADLAPITALAAPAEASAASGEPVPAHGVRP